MALVEYLENEGLDYRQLVLERLRPGDLITPTFGLITPVLDANGRVNRIVSDARRRGVLFDLGHGSRSGFGTRSPPRRRDSFPM